MGHDLIFNYSLPTSMEDQPALGPAGKLLDASQIEWFHNPDDPHPMRPIAIPQGTVLIYFTLSWSWANHF